MRAKEYNPYIEQGSDWVFEGECLNSNGTPFDLTEWAGRSQFRYRTPPFNVAIVAVVETAIPSGRVRATVSADSSSALSIPSVNFIDPLLLAWDLEIENTVTHRVIRLFNGIAQISPEATKPLPV
jgi:hypothetical protein